MTTNHAAEVFSPEELATRWGLSTKTLANWRSLGIGPAFTKIGRKIRYSIVAVRAAEKKGVSPLSGFNGPPAHKRQDH